ncbi:hypothetical protein VKT23_016346 [Stygiomarasmius scandens]|uniref:Uncharacterized protein n=1 Tax=Marasmiellus scandens TaxID=2682957 RepID=A0ABR1IZP8_9AGAR
MRIHSSKVRYRHARTALVVLDPDGSWSDEFRELRDSDVRGLNESALTKEEVAEREALRQRGFNTERQEDQLEAEVEEGIVVLPEGVLTRVQGEDRRTLSWIWYGPTISEDDPAFRDAIRIKWCKAQARMLRWKEECILLVEEIRRMQEFAKSKSKWWLTRKVGMNEMRKGADLSPELMEGLDAYAEQQSIFQREKADKVRERWTKLIEHVDKVLNRIPDIELCEIEMEVGDDDGQGAEEAM